MKKIYYQLWEEVAPHIFLHYNTFSNRFLFLNEEKHATFTQTDCNEIKDKDPLLYSQLVENLFIVPDDYQEQEIVDYRRTQMVFDSRVYEIVINTTLDCNLNCWYCYEKRIKDSRLAPDVIEAIKKHIVREYSQMPFGVLKISFFGGEPFLDFEGIKIIIDYCKQFCEEKQIKLLLEFTTNATLLTPAYINYLKDFSCQFQITLDGDREVHNKVKKDHTKEYDTYQKTLDNIHLINDEIHDHWMAIRINFDNRTLNKIDEIISDIDFLDREKCFVILKKVWQVKAENIDKELLLSAIQKFFDRNFLLDYYIIPKGNICSCCKQRQVLFNYDGKIFKCTTIPSFDDSNALGELDKTSGYVKWNLSKMAAWTKDMQRDVCKKCKWYPVCLGICNRQLLAHPHEKMCHFDPVNLTQKEYLMYSFKFHYLKNKLYSR